MANVPYLTILQCDRTKPCSACCARGHPRECQFTLSEGTAFGPIQQSLELRKLRAENQKLKEQLWQAKIPVPGDNDDEGSLTGHGVTGFRANQRRFGAEEPMESLYFGTPGFASIVEDVGRESFFLVPRTHPCTVRRLTRRTEEFDSHNA